MLIRKYSDFMSEKLFFKKKPKFKEDYIDTCVSEIITFLNDNDIYDWNDFEDGNKFDRFVISNIIDSYTESYEQVKEIKFRLRVRLSDSDQLKNMIKEYEDLEEYENCSLISKELDKRRSNS